MEAFVILQGFPLNRPSLKDVRYTIITTALTNLYNQQIVTFIVSGP